MLRKALESHPTLKGVCADAGYRKTFVAAVSEFGLKIDISDRIKPNEWQILPKRWRVERTFGWMSHSRRLSKDYEIRTLSAAAIVILSHISILLKRF
ncbi:transposase, IS4-like family protein [Clostridium sp. MSTE9]|nr:transposase, IS4-like family protein [Clostridium sp. MSTE9]